ncbi:hypothetical protein PsorP6_012665 [Peronosclerospora sorghi]|uniref:Uncharacterized protein n=1 Tax=Peronosclerospora sorghi TaxID=230839 RepID=A0ACC0WHZ7_9STRA|nr:hypothetical protein PsorP6_012665 [Peronosclerospora sorghi]
MLSGIGSPAAMYLAVTGVDCAKVRKAAAQAAKQGQVIVPHTYLLLDTRVRIQFEMVHFPEAVNIPTLRLWNRITPN